MRNVMIFVVVTVFNVAAHAQVDIPPASFEAKFGPAQNEVTLGIRDRSKVEFWGLQRTGTKVVYSTLSQSGGQCNLPKGTKFTGDFDESTKTVKGSTELRSDCQVELTLHFDDKGLSGGMWSLGGARLRSYYGGAVLPVAKAEAGAAQPK